MVQTMTCHRPGTYKQLTGEGSRTPCERICLCMESLQDLARDKLAAAMCTWTFQLHGALPAEPTRFAICQGSATASVYHV